jgi:hypothetical protein
MALVVAERCFAPLSICLPWKSIEAISKPHLTLDGCVESLLFCYAKLKAGRLIALLSTSGVGVFLFTPMSTTFVFAVT